MIAGVITLIACDKEEPVIALSVDKTSASVGETLNIEYGAKDNGKIANYWLNANVYSSDSVWMEGDDILKVNPYDSGDDVAVATYQYEVPAVGANGDSITAGCYIEISGGAVDRRSNGLPTQVYVTVE